MKYISYRVDEKEIDAKDVESIANRHKEILDEEYPDKEEYNKHVKNSTIIKAAEGISGIAKDAKAVADLDLLNSVTKASGSKEAMDLVNAQFAKKERKLRKDRTNIENLTRKLPTHLGKDELKVFYTPENFGKGVYRISSEWGKNEGEKQVSYEDFFDKALSNEFGKRWPEKDEREKFLVAQEEQYVDREMSDVRSFFDSELMMDSINELKEKSPRQAKKYQAELKRKAKAIAKCEKIYDSLKKAGVKKECATKAMEALEGYGSVLPEGMRKKVKEILNKQEQKWAQKAEKLEEKRDNTIEKSGLRGSVENAKNYVQYTEQQKELNKELERAYDIADMHVSRSNRVAALTEQMEQTDKVKEGIDEKMSKAEMGLRNTIDNEFSTTLNAQIHITGEKKEKVSEIV